MRSLNVTEDYQADEYNGPLGTKVARRFKGIAALIVPVSYKARGRAPTAVAILIVGQPFD